MIDDLDRILADEAQLAPSPGFEPAVMDAVRDVHEWAIAIPFPWRRFAMGLAGALVCAPATFALLRPEMASGLPVFEISTGVEAWVRNGAGGVFCALIALIGSLLTVRISIELTSG